MKPSLSIKWRLALQFSLLVLLILLLSGGVIFLLFETRVRSDIDTLLFAQYEHIRTGMLGNERSESDSAFRERVATTIEDTRSIGLFTIVTNSKGGIMVRTSQQDFPLPQEDGYATVRSENGNAYRLLVKRERGYTIVVGQDLRAYEQTCKNLLMVLLVVFGVMTLISFTLSAVFAGRAIRPLALLHRRVRNMNPERLPNVLLASDYPSDEIGRLAQTFDEFLMTIAAALRREKQFTQDASHELRTPLMLMKSSLELVSLQQDVLTPLQRERMSMMQSAVHRMERLVEEMLFLSRGRKDREKEMILMGPFLREYCQTYAELAREKGLAFSLDIRGDFSLSVSPIVLEKVLGNLLRNAIHFTQKGGITVTVDHRSVSIADTGMGIASGDIPHIFERLYRADASRSRHVHGFGLGLAICREICSQEGWQISVESRIGEGSRFTVRFPKGEGTPEERDPRRGEGVPREEG